MNRRHRRSGGGGGPGGSGSRRLTGFNSLVRRAQRRAREESDDNNRRERYNDNGGIAQRNNGNAAAVVAVAVADGNGVGGAGHVDGVVGVGNDVHNNDNSDNNHNHNRYANHDNVLSPRRSSSYRVFNSIFFQLFSRWPKSRKIEQSGGKSPKKPYLFRPFVRRNIPAHNDSALCPLPRSGHRIVVNEDYIYCFGGFNSAIECSNVQPDLFRATEPLFQELWRFSKLTKTWKHLPCTGEVPLTLVSASLVMLDHNRLLAFGGSGYPFGEHNSNQIHICDLNTLVWSLIEVGVDDSQLDDDDDTPREPLPGYGQATALDRENNILYVCGGTDGLNYNCDVHQFDITTRTWLPLSGTIGPEMGRYRHEMALYKGALYLIGGGTSTVDLSTDQIDKFDISTRTWSRVKTKPFKSGNSFSTYPSGRISHAFVQADNLIYMIGGRSAQSDFDDAWSLNLDTLQWTSHPEMVLPKATSFLAADCTADGQLSIFGGVYNSLNPRRAKRLNSVDEVWIKIPPLKRLALDALVYGYSQLDTYQSYRQPIEFLIKKFKRENIKHIVTLPQH